MSVLHPSSFEQLHNALHAEQKLAELDLFADLAELHDSEPCQRLRALFADQYRKAVGVHPAQRDTFRSALERIRDDGNMPVASWTPSPLTRTDRPEGEKPP